MDGQLIVPAMPKDNIFNQTSIFIYVGCFWFFTITNII